MNMLFVLTFKGSIEKWISEGIANREMELCMAYLRNNLFDKVVIFSYGYNDKEFLRQLNYEPALLDRIELILPDKKLKSLKDFIIYSFSVKNIRLALSNDVAICRTNQINGAWTALLARFLGCPLLLRCGYILSRRLFLNKDYLKGMVALVIEALAISAASTVSVTTKDAQNYFAKLVPFRRNRIFVAPTYVNTDIFQPSQDKTVQKEERAIFVGRLEKQKNIIPMIEACAQLKLPLTIVGRGSLKNEILDTAKKLELDLDYIESLNNEEIANLYDTHKYFILPSLQEGLPKVLIEAMSSGMICIGTPTSGITDLIVDQKTGYLTAGFKAECIAATLSGVIKGEASAECGIRARQFVLDNHSIDSYMRREYENIKRYMKK